jgi:hypothetical protein
VAPVDAAARRCREPTRGSACDELGHRGIDDLRSLELHEVPGVVHHQQRRLRDLLFTASAHVARHRVDVLVEVAGSTDPDPVGDHELGVGGRVVEVRVQVHRDAAHRL